MFLTCVPFSLTPITSPSSQPPSAVCILSFHTASPFDTASPLIPSQDQNATDRNTHHHHTLPPSPINPLEPCASASWPSNGARGDPCRTAQSAVVVAPATDPVLEPACPVTEPPLVCAAPAIEAPPEVAGMPIERAPEVAAEEAPDMVLEAEEVAAPVIDRYQRVFQDGSS
jgi:hypothetical protein